MNTACGFRSILRREDQCKAHLPELSVSSDMSKNDEDCGDAARYQASDDLGDAASNAVRYIHRMLRKLERALARQPDLDLSSALPSEYHSELAWKKKASKSSQGGMAC